MQSFKPEKIFVERAALGFKKTERILAKFPGITPEIIEDSKALILRVKNESGGITLGKRYLHLAYDKGNPFRLFSEAKEYLACDYYTLHVVEGCHLECSYCILQSYLTNPLLTVFVNIEEMLETLQSVLNNNSDKFYRIGIGQLADALALDPVTEFSKDLVPFFRYQKNAVLELKTKSTNIENLLEMDGGGKTIVAWSLNSEKIAREEEHKCASIRDRLEAARRVTREKNYRVAFHFDPLVDYAGCLEDYRKLADQVAAFIPAENIAWISMGCLRMMNPLPKIMKERFPKSPLPYGEWIRGMDGKTRYFKARRIEMYESLTKALKRHFPETTYYLSMESPEVWERVLGWRPDRDSLCNYLDRAGQGEVLEKLRL